MSSDKAARRREKSQMNYMRTAILLAGLTGLFMAVGYLIGGGSGALIALIIAAGTNLFSYWNADKLVLSMHSAQEVDEHSAPELVAIVRELAQRAQAVAVEGRVRERDELSVRRTVVDLEHQGRPPQLLRRPRCTRRHQSIHRLPRTAAQGRVGGLCQKAVRRTRGGARLSRPLHPSRRHR
jgi:hypothetical protein